MAHFAKIEDGVVVQVVVVSNDDAPDPFPQSEELGVQFLQKLGLEGEWKQTSYNGNFRVRYASVGYFYDPDRDAYIPPKPYDSWVLNEEKLDWEAPVPYPARFSAQYTWNEETLQWDAIPFEALDDSEEPPA